MAILLISYDLDSTHRFYDRDAAVASLRADGFYTGSSEGKSLPASTVWKTVSPGTTAQAGVNSALGALERASQKVTHIVGLIGEDAYLP